MQHIQGISRNQLLVFSLEDPISQDNPVRFIDAFVPTYQKGSKNQYQLVVAEKAWKKLKERLKSISRKTAPVKLEERIAKIKEVQRGWLNYFRGTSIMGKLRDLDGWLRNRLRYCIWHSR